MTNYFSRTPLRFAKFLFMSLSNMPLIMGIIRFIGNGLLPMKTVVTFVRLAPIAVWL